MQDEYDFRQGTRGALDPLPPGKTRITIRLDDVVLDWFRTQADHAGGGNYQTLINHALQDYIRNQSLEELVRRVIREELHNAA